MSDQFWPSVCLVLLSAAVVPAAPAADLLETVTVTARLREELPQAVPIALSLVDAATLDRTNAGNLSQLTTLLPAVTYSSPNPRNTALTIRGLGSSVVAVSQANDGLEPGVGFYVDGVYHARPATAAFDFVDLARVEVLRGPQGTLFGSNSTAGAISLTTRAPTFAPEGVTEASLGEYGLRQTKAALSGALIGDLLAGRLSAAVTQRDGLVKNVLTNSRVNNSNTATYRGQLLFQTGANFHLRLSIDHASFRGTCCTQVYVTVAPTLKPAARQYASLAAGLGYTPPSLNPYDRMTALDAELGVRTDEGGVSATATWDKARYALTSISAWRYWNWDAANDRDYTGLPIQTLQHIPSRQDQYSQELRIASRGTNTMDWYAGLYAFRQRITGEPITEYGSAATYWLLGPVTTNSATTYPANLLSGYGTDGHTDFSARSVAVFAELIWHLSGKLSVTTGWRYTDEYKHGDYVSTVYGGLATTNARLLRAQLSILRPQGYSARVADSIPTGRVNLVYRWSDAVMTYLSYANGQKSGGINMSGLPLNAANLPALSTAVIKPERSQTAELGAKTNWFGGQLTFNGDLFATVVRDFQANVVDTGPGALRGYLANIEQVRVRGLELEGALQISRSLSLHASSSWTDARYRAYHNAPCPIEAISAATAVCDLTGRSLAATPHLATAAGAMLTYPLRDGTDLFVDADYIHRGPQFGDPSDSAYAVLPAYDVVNARAGWRGGHAELYVWAKNLGNSHHLQNVTIQAGNSGLILGSPSDPRAAGLTLRLRL